MIGTRPKRIALGPAAQRATSTGRTHDALDQFAPDPEYTLPKQSRPHMDPKRTFGVDFR